MSRGQGVRDRDLQSSSQCSHIEIAITACESLDETAEHRLTAQHAPKPAAGTGAASPRARPDVSCPSL
jgi:hypothetical protein